ncbi:MAG: hypothetical protein WC780_00655 [Lentimicrobiaceae bacterium]|jgi:uncharacterized membrane protein
MNWAYLHIIVNHFPIVGVIIGSLILIAGMGFKNEGIKISGLSTIIFAALMAVIADLTGDPAKEAVKGMPDIVGSLISKHEDMASVALFLVIPAGLMAALTLYSIWKKEKSVGFLTIITLVLSMISCGAMGYVGHTGGQIRHTELRNDTTKQYIIEHQNDNEEE